MVLAMLILAVYLPVAWNRERLIKEEREDLLAWRTISNIKREINLAVSFGSGYQRNFTTPDKIITSNYTIEAINQSLAIFINWDNRQIVEQIITPNITSVPKPGVNTIKNVNGVIIFEQN